MGRFSETVKLSPTLAKSRYARFMDRLERYFQLMTYGVLAVAGAYIIVGVSSEIIGTAMAAPATYGVPYEVKRMPPILKKIAKAESMDSHYCTERLVANKLCKKTDIGKVLVNKGGDVGRFQINEPIHGKTAKAMGIDIYSEKGNEEFAQYLFSTQGSVPWRASAEGKWGWLSMK